jgi:hypothetical protein
VTKTEAQRVGSALQTVGYFDGTRAKTVRVLKEGDRFVIAFVVNDGAWNDAAAVRSFSHVGSVISWRALDGRPLVVKLCDRLFVPHKAIEVAGPGPLDAMANEFRAEGGQVPSHALPQAVAEVIRTKYPGGAVKCAVLVPVDGKVTYGVMLDGGGPRDAQNKPVLLQLTQEGSAIDPESALGQYIAGRTLLQDGRFAEAVTATQHCLASPSLSDPLRQRAAFQLQLCAGLIVREGKLSAVLAGAGEPDTAMGWIALGQLCQQYKRRHAAAARCYAAAFVTDPRLADYPGQPHRYNAAYSAALAAAGQAVDAENLPDKVQLMLRRQALAWLRADLTAYAKLAERDDPKPKELVRQRLAHWCQDSDLDSVRDNEALDKLADHERQQWRRLWDDVAALLSKVQPKP